MNDADRIMRLEERFAEIEKTQVAQSSTLEQIEKKLDKVIEMGDKNDERYQNKEHCNQLSDFQESQLKHYDEKIITIGKKFEEHLTRHWNSSDRVIGYIQTALIGIVLAKLANIF